MKKSFCLLVLWSVCIPAAHAQAEKKQTQPTPASKPVFRRIADVMPQFPGDMEDFILQNTHYPDSARQQRLEGRVVVKLIIDETGQVTQPEIAQGIHPILNAEALRVVKLMPPWKPALQNNKPLSIVYWVAVKFQLPK